LPNSDQWPTVAGRSQPGCYRWAASWYDLLADAVVELSGTDGADLLAMAADRAASGQAREPGEGDPEQALANLEADLRAEDALADHGVGDHLVPPGTAIDLLADLPVPPREPPKPSDN
jgi:hypothetical protein